MISENRKHTKKIRQQSRSKNRDTKPKYNTYTQSLKSQDLDQEYEDECNFEFDRKNSFESAQYLPYGPRPWWNEERVLFWSWNHYHNDHKLVHDFIIDKLNEASAWGGDISNLIANYCKSKRYWDDTSTQYINHSIPEWFQD